MSKRLQTLIEQTQFLVARQKEAKDACAKAFTGLLERIDKKIKGCDAAQSQRLQRVHEVLSGQAEQLIQDSENDIDFLRDQLRALTEITKTSDKEKAKELLAAMIDPTEEVMPTPEFKQAIIEELAAAQDGFDAVLEDIASALEEGDITNVEVMLEQLANAAAEEGEDDDDCEDDDDEDGEEDGCCGSGGCAPGGCGSCETGCGAPKLDGKGVDIFGSLSAYDRELAKDKKNSELN